MMRVGVYFSPWGRSLSPTGVGRHAIEMTSALAAHPEIEASRFTTRGEHERNKGRLPAKIAELPVRLLSGGETLSRWMLLGLPFCRIDQNASDLDWVYCTKEQPVSTRKSKLAVNVHDALPFEGDVPGMPQRRSWRQRFKWNRILARVRHADLITTVSEFTKNRLLELFDFDPDRIVVTGNGVTDEYFRGPQPRDQEVLQRFGVQSQQYFLSVGSLTWRKGGDLLLDVANLPRNKRPDLPILVTGRRHDAGLLARYEAERKQDPALPIRLLGYMEDEDQRVLLSHAVALVFPTRYEGFGIPALEAMAAGTMVISSKSSAMPEVVGDAGLMLESMSAESLADIMQRAISDSQLRQTLIERGTARVQNFHWRHCAAKLVDAMTQRC